MLFDVLSRDLNVFDRHFLEASAGTGKTFAIEHLAVRLLIEGDAPLLIEQILVVTFTRAATRELKMRIRRNLCKAKEELSKGHSSSDYLQAILEKGESAVKSALERIDAALVCFDAAQIYTLHGFCYRMLKEFAFEAEVGLEVPDPDARDHVHALENFIKIHLKEHLCPLQYSPGQIRSVLKRSSSDPRKMIGALMQLISSGKEIQATPSHAELLSLFLEEIAALPPIDPDSFKADLSLLIPNYKEMTGKEIPEQIDLLAEILASKHCTQKQFDALCSTDFFLEKMDKENEKKVKKKFLEASSLYYPLLIGTLRKSLLPLLRAAGNPSRTFLRLGKELREKSRPFLEKKDLFSPDDLLFKVEEALQKPRFVENVKKKFRAAIIDEFQDTDPIQWKIFQKLFLSLDAICLVGDPKQSIYAFRNADVYVYLDAAKAMGEEAKKHLNTNFRSTPRLVEALNTLFSKAQGGWMELPAKDASLAVLPVQSGASLSSPETEVPIAFFIASSKKGKSKKFPTTEMLENKVFPYLASEISKLRQNIAYHEIAILVRDRFQGRAVIDYLKACGIPAMAKRTGSITETDAYFALKEVLFAACAPSDMSRLKAALGGPLIGWEASALEMDVSNLPLLEAKAKMQHLSRVLYEEGFARFFQTFLSTSWGAAPVLQDLFARGEEQLYSDLKKLSELLIEEERGLKAEELLCFLEEIAFRSQQSEDQRMKVPSPEEKGSVTIMTIHMSKGLEFEAVFALGLAARHKPSAEIAVKIDGKSVFSSLDPLDPASLQALREQDAEKMRQFYVALTRAKRHLYIPLLLEEEKKEFEIGEASASELFFARLLQAPEDYTASGEILDFLRPQSGSDLNDREEGDIEAISPTSDRSKMGRYDGRKKSRISPLAVYNDLYRIADKITLEKATEILETLSPLIHYCILEEAPQPSAQIQDTLIKEISPPSPLSYHFESEHLLSFSSLAKKEYVTEVVKPSEEAPLSPHTLPLGSETGSLLHLLFEKIFKRRLHHPLNKVDLSHLIDEEIRFSPLEKFRPILLPWIIDLFTKPLTTFSLSDIPAGQLQQEMEFLFPTEQGMMKGFADLFFAFEGKYYLLDWKSNYLGQSDDAYTQEKMAEAMRSHQYDLQASIYAEALARYVKLFDNRPFSECFGGAIYYFVRGRAAFHFIPEPYSKRSP